MKFLFLIFLPIIFAVSDFKKVGNYIFKEHSTISQLGTGTISASSRASVPLKGFLNIRLPDDSSGEWSVAKTSADNKIILAAQGGSAPGVDGNIKMRVFSFNAAQSVIDANAETTSSLTFTHTNPAITYTVDIDLTLT